MMESSQKAPDFLLDRLTQNAAKYPSKSAVTFLASGPEGGKVEAKLTYSELDQQTSAVASRLLQSGLSRGDRFVQRILSCCCHFYSLSHSFQHTQSGPGVPAVARLHGGFSCLSQGGYCGRAGLSTKPGTTGHLGHVF